MESSSAPAFAGQGAPEIRWTPISRERSSRRSEPLAGPDAAFAAHVLADQEPGAPPRHAAFAARQAPLESPDPPSPGLRVLRYGELPRAGKPPLRQAVDAGSPHDA